MTSIAVNPSSPDTLQVGLLGIGTVGMGVFNVLKRNQSEIMRRAGRGIRISMVADLDTARAQAAVGDAFHLGDLADLELLGRTLAMPAEVAMAVRHKDAVQREGGEDGRGHDGERRGEPLMNTNLTLIRISDN